MSAPTLSAPPDDKRLSDDDLRHIIRFAPLVSIDILLVNAGRILVALRNNEPARNTYFVPGGIIRKSETRADAFRRILLKETGIISQIDAARFLGVYEHHYDTNRFDEPGFGTHYFALGYMLDVDNHDIRLDDQHSRYEWIARDSLLNRDDVHENTKAFLRG